MIEILIGLLVPIVLGLVAYVLRELNDMKKKLDKMISKDDATDMVEFHARMQVEVQKQVNRGFQEDVKRIESKLDKLIDRLL